MIVRRALDIDEKQFATLLGERIRQARTQQGLSQEQLAEMTGRTQNVISRVENAEQNLFASDLVKFAVALQVPVSYLVTGDTAADEYDDLITAEIRSRLKKVRSKKALLKLVKDFCEFAEEAESGTLDSD
jgi:transcriptional regulator with XRE-family HTH domain